MFLIFHETLILVICYKSPAKRLLLLFKPLILGATFDYRFMLLFGLVLGVFFFRHFYKMLYLVVYVVQRHGGRSHDSRTGMGAIYGRPALRAMIRLSQPSRGLQ